MTKSLHSVTFYYGLNKTLVLMLRRSKVCEGELSFRRRLIKTAEGV